MGERRPTRQRGSIRWYQEGRQFDHVRSGMPDKPDWLPAKRWDEIVPQIYLGGDTLEQCQAVQITWEVNNGHNWQNEEAEMEFEQSGLQDYRWAQLKT